MRIKLSTVHGPAALEWYSFDRYPVRIGRKYDNHVAITDPSVSRYHCEITQRDGELWVVDLGSVNGITVNGERAVERTITDGDELTVGLVRFRINTGADSSAADSDNSPAPPVKLSRMHTAVLDASESAWLPRLTPGDSGAERHLVVLLELCRALQARLPVGEITQRLLDLLERALPFGCGSVVLVDADSGRSMRVTKLPPDHEVELDSSAGLRGESSLTPQILTVPLIVNRTTLGAVSVQSDGKTEFDRHHLHLTGAAASTAAAAIDNARREERLARRMSLLEQERHWFADLAGDSAHARRIRHRVEEIAASAAPALITGPRGIGKDGAGRAIHSKSAFGQGPFVLARVLGRAQEVLEKRLFGVDTGAGVELGWVDQAEGGTLFLDRIDGLGPDLQRRMYAMLETGDFARTGGGSVVQARCRIIASAGERIESAVASNEFYPELYLRLKGLSVHMPGLRERPSDIREMAQMLAAKFAEHAGRAFEGYAEGALVALTLHQWPDNVRELESVVRSAEMRRSGIRIEMEDLPEEVSEAVNPDAPGGYHHEVRESRRQIILTAMEKARGSYSVAADLLRINRTYLHRLIRNLDLRDEIAERFGRE